jgi:hypothetical protein|tara:strand:- start:2548 stop:2724 length:177 start_codon:yes stop_codon:yes gene_type:complete
MVVTGVTAIVPKNHALARAPVAFEMMFVLLVIHDGREQRHEHQQQHETQRAALFLFGG